MTLAQPDVLYMHPLPADRGNEVTDEVIDGPNSVVYQEAENRLHTAKAIMALTMADLPNSNMSACLKPWSSRWAAMPSRGPASRGRFRSSSNTPRRRWATSMPLFRSDARIVITHGNGPQIGNILIRVEEGERRVPRLPLDTCVSDSQGGMGYMIQRIACELFRRERIRPYRRHRDHAGAGERGRPRHGRIPASRSARSTAASEVAAGPARSGRTGSMREIEPGRWRRVVASPRPLRILEEEAIACLVRGRRRGDRLRRRRNPGGLGRRPPGGRRGSDR